MSSTTIRIDPKTKKAAHHLAQLIGFSFNDLVNVLLKKAIREKGVDLRQVTLTQNGFTPAFEKSILDAEKEGDPIEFESIDELIAYAKQENQVSEKIQKRPAKTKRKTTRTIQK